LPDESVDGQLDDGAWARWLSDVRDFRSLLEGESARGVGVLARAYLDDLLDAILRSHAMRCPGDAARCIADSFDRRIKACRELALLGEQTLGDLERFRMIGKLFAHTPPIRTLTHKDVVREIRHLSGARAFKKLGITRDEGATRLAIDISMTQCLAELSEALVRPRPCRNELAT